MSLAFATSNVNKIDIAQKFLEPFNISFNTIEIDVDEIQSEDFERIAIKKAQDSFSQYQKPLFITDHSWTITALNGFPGPYMRYINKWLTADDLLRLMQGVENREIILHDNLCYIDEKGYKLFPSIHTGTILLEKQGHALPAQEITSLTKDGESIAKKLESDPSAFEESDLYTEFGNWLKENRPEVI